MEHHQESDLWSAFSTASNEGLSAMQKKKKEGRKEGRKEA
jgi:hypothetical protein